MGRRSDIDWEKIAGEYRAGHLTLEQIAQTNNVSISSITLKAKKGGWSRDLSKAVEQATRAALIEASIGRADEIGREIGKQSAGKQISGVEAAAQVRFAVLESHQRLADKLKTLGASLYAELAAQSTGDPRDVPALIAAVSQNDPEVARELAKAISYPSRIASAEKLANMITKTAELEKKAWGIKDEDRQDDDPTKKCIEVSFVEVSRD